MKRLLILLVVLGLLMVFPATAMAGKPDCSDPNSTHPHCDDGGPDGELTPGYSCEEGAAYDPEATDFDVVLDGDNESVCIDVDSDAGDWTYTIVTEGRVNSLWMAVKDSTPGDFCYQADLWRRDDIPAEVTRSVPAAVIDACDGKIAPRDYTDSADSLVFAAMYSGKGSVTIHVDLP